MAVEPEPAAEARAGAEPEPEPAAEREAEPEPATGAKTEAKTKTGPEVQRPANTLDELTAFSHPAIRRRRVTGSAEPAFSVKPSRNCTSSFTAR
ncbi:hypothetical protein KDW55_06125 [Burkholderia sp. AU19243]|uniref:hypothetical protein n=1 Tax=Burkholderia TaxID=32008 RepID=UPI00142E1682|nr:MULTISPECIES: hypothetical protein [Burkholderia]MBR8141357.1 hypothetical protein [Burkholderia vietnamiensis]MBR8362898.1 hypothetical protein [Burkholderia sp. AU19243]MCA8309080.1 hypothetical protein [Burkholderia sp. AU28942]QTO51068.1 hypothetical protein J8I86_16590 [Burkholderia latens]